MRHSMPFRFQVLILIMALPFAACGGDDPAVATDAVASPIGVRRVGWKRVESGAAKPTAEVAGHLRPRDGLETWEVTAPKWSFEEGKSARPLRLTGVGDKRVVIPGPFELQAFDRLSIMVANPARGSIRATLTTNQGIEISGTVDVIKGRARHPAVLKLPRAILPDETIESLSLDFEIKRAVTIYGIDFIRQPLLATLPSPETGAGLGTGAGLVNVGREARRGVGLGPGEVMRSSFEAGAEATVGLWVTALVAENARLEKKAVLSVKLVQKSPLEGGTAQAPQIRSIDLQLGWTKVDFADLAGGAYSLEVALQSSDPAVVAVVSELLLAGPSADSPKTVLLVTSDTHRADHLGILRSEDDEPLDTPSLDALAESGVLFESAWATSNKTIPSHSALLTGRHPRDTKVLGNDSSLGAERGASASTLAEAFAAEGYRTVAVLSSSLLAHEYSGLGRGFDLVIRPAGSEARADESLQSVLAELDGGLPTFVWLHLFDAHAPYLPPGDFDRRYYPKDRDPFDPGLPEIDLEGGRMPGWLQGLRDHAFARAQYRAEIAYLDSQIAALLVHPRVEAGITAFTSDHGEVFARNGVFYDHKGLTPDTLRVPLILRAPGLENAGGRVGSAVSQVDLGRTLLNLAGHGATEYPGVDLLGPDRPEDEPHHAVSRRFAALTQGRWHAILTLADLSESGDGRWGARHQLELYDIEADPGCADDLASQETQQAKRFRTAITDWLGNADLTLSASRPNLDVAARLNLEALGYPTAEDAGSGELFDTECLCNQCLLFK